MSFADIFSYVTIFSSLIPITTALLCKWNKNTIVTSIFLLGSVVFIAEILNEIYVRTGQRGVIIYNIAFVIEFLIVGYLYKQLFNGTHSKLITGSLIFFLLFFLGMTAFVKSQHIQTHQSLVWTVGGTIVILMAIAHLFYLSKTVQREPHILKYGPFWISIALIGYFVYSISLFFMAKQIHSEKMEPATSLMIWNFHNLNYIIRNLLLTLALYCIANQRDPNAIDYKKYGIDEDWRSKMKPNPNLFRNANEEGLANG